MLRHRNEGEARDKAAKVRHVLKATQSRPHHCHWPGCDKQCPPAMWGCRRHWMMLPKYLRDKVWAAYRVGQEVTMTPSRAYLDVAHEVEQWVLDNYGKEARPSPPDPEALF